MKNKILNILNYTKKRIYRKKRIDMGSSRTPNQNKPKMKPYGNLIKDLHENEESSVSSFSSHSDASDVSDENLNENRMVPYTSRKKSSNSINNKSKFDKIDVDPIKFIKDGSILLKLCQRNYNFHFRFFEVTKNERYLVWLTPNKKDNNSKIKISTIRSVTKCTYYNDILKKYITSQMNSQDFYKLLLKIVYNNNNEPDAESQTLYLIAKSETELNIWYCGLKHLTKSNVFNYYCGYNKDKYKNSYIDDTTNIKLKKLHLNNSVENCKQLYNAVNNSYLPKYAEIDKVFTKYRDKFFKRLDKVNKILPEQKDMMNLDKYVYPFLDNINKIIMSYSNLVNNSFISKDFKIQKI